ncbi:iron complex transport system permease protein [Enterovirga rhinocerotis]|uniref:Iron complex transport system permease protein n=1 Tax=Enterovirga rhinocerotis TaxID=1339210 RepID=A0A4R7BX60_9HYPH|nr:iron complex transport system permease protein [Enterovirga rhinocerotis]
MIATSGPALPGTAPRWRSSAGRIRGWIVLFALALLVLLTGLASLGTGAVSLPLARVAAIVLAGREAVLGDPALVRDGVIVFDIRLPRTLIGLLVGATLATGGALLQGLFRNPLADPALVGVSSGAALAAAVTIVLGHHFVSGSGPVPFTALPIAAFVGGLGATMLLYAIATRRGRTSVATMLLAGVAISALAGAGTGLLAFMSDDRQLRDLTFWTLGSVAGSTWSKFSMVGPVLLAVLVAAPFLSRALNALVLGEAEAFHLGIAVQRSKRLLILLVAVGVGCSVAVTGLISFVGLVVPHLIRLAVGPDHRLLLPASALGGAVLLVASDMVARVVVAPAELPIGIVTALIGAPYFLWLLLRRNTVLDA